MAESMTPQPAARTALQLQQEADDAALARQLQNGSALDGDKDKEELIDLESEDDAPGSPMSVGGADAGGSSDAVPPPAPVVPAVPDTAAGCIIVLKRGTPHCPHYVPLCEFQPPTPEEKRSGMRGQARRPARAARRPPRPRRPCVASFH